MEQWVLNIYKRHRKQTKAKKRSRRSCELCRFHSEQHGAAVTEFVRFTLSRKSFNVWTTVLIVLSCHVLTSIIRVIESYWEWTVCVQLFLVALRVSAE